jgi:hypothetical protein
LAHGDDVVVDLAAQVGVIDALHRVAAARHADVVHRQRPSAAVLPDVLFRLDPRGAEGGAGVGGVVVGDVEVVVGQQALRDHEVMRLVAGDGILAVGRQAPRNQENGGGRQPDHAFVHAGQA